MNNERIHNIIETMNDKELAHELCVLNAICNIPGIVESMFIDYINDMETELKDRIAERFLEMQTEQ